MTATTMVTLDEVLRAAGNRRAALAPETSGYFALAIGDATSRLPLGIDDRAVALTTEGTVLVPRKGNLVAPAEAARILRDALGRLLAVSAGSMPGLSAAAKPRTEADVEGVVASIEGALIPVNRSAARRALARLARETLRAKEQGKLGAVRAVAPPTIANEPAAAPEIALRNAPAVVYLTGMGVEVLIETNETPEPYVLLEVEVAPEPVSAPEPAIAEPAIEAAAPANPVVELAPASAASIETVRAIAAEAIDDGDSIVPPSRETTPTLLGVGDVGVYITAALSPSPSEIEQERGDLTEPCSFASERMDDDEEEEEIPSIRRTISGLGDTSTARYVEEAVEAAAAFEAFKAAAAIKAAEATETAEAAPPAQSLELESPESIASDLSDVPTAAAASFEDDDATTNALPFVLVVEKKESARLAKKQSRTSRPPRLPSP